MPKTLKIGIVMDNYKRPLFRKRLDKKGYKYEEKIFTDTSTIFKINGKQRDVKKIHRICAEVEIEAKRSN